MCVVRNDGARTVAQSSQVVSVESILRCFYPISICTYIAKQYYPSGLQASIKLFYFIL